MSDSAKVVQWLAFTLGILVIVTLSVGWVAKLALGVTVGLLVGLLGRWMARRSFWPDD